MATRGRGQKDNDQRPGLPILFADLQKLIQAGDFNKAIKAANRVLNESPEDREAFHCKILCYVELGKFGDALQHMNLKAELASELHFERAYCEYRQNDIEKALRTLESAPEKDERIQELLAQVHYKLENYEKCLEIYQWLVKNAADDYEEERETNMSAVIAALSLWTDGATTTRITRADTYELCYNEATRLIGDGDFSNAIEKLKAGEELCREAFDDDDSDDLESELAVIRTQLAYCYQMRDHSEKAMNLYNMVLKQRPDPQVCAVASNNIICINKDQNVFDSKKKIRTATADGLDQKLTDSQRQGILVNRSLLNMYMNQSDQCHQSVRAGIKTYPQDDRFPLIKASQYLREKKIPKAIEELQSVIASSQSASVNLKLALAQLFLLQGSVFQACDALKDMGDYSYRLGVISALVTLYSHQEDQESASAVLEEAIQWYKQNKPKSAELSRLVRASADFYLRHGVPEKATGMLEELRKKDPKDLKTLAQLISAYSKFDAAKARLVSKDLPSSEELAQNVDVEALESAVNFGPKYIKKAQKQEQSPKPNESGDQIMAKKKKKKKKAKPPQNMEGPVDPERWIPRRERSYFKGKRRDRRRGEIGKGTQGAVSGSSAQDLDASKSPTSATSPTTADASGGAIPKQPSTGTRKQQHNKQKRKKKGKSSW